MSTTLAPGVGQAGVSTQALEPGLGVGQEGVSAQLWWWLMESYERAWRVEGGLELAIRSIMHLK